MQALTYIEHGKFALIDKPMPVIFSCMGHTHCDIM